MTRKKQQKGQRGRFIARHQSRLDDTKQPYMTAVPLDYDPERPYEPPEEPNLTIDNDALTEQEATDALWKYLSA